MEQYVYLALGAAAVLIIVWQMIAANRSSKLKLKERLRKNWGKYPDKEYDYNDFQSISHYYRKRAKEREGVFSIDDITWNDLDMDSLFMAVNNTCSSVGQEYLYDMLRTPSFDPEELRERSRLAQLFEERPDIREALQLALVKVGYTRKVSLMDYIDELQALKTENGISHYLHIALLLAAVGLIFLDPGIGVLALIFAVGYNIFMYYRCKAKVEAYFICVSAVIRLVKSSQAIYHLSIPELKQYGERLKTASDALKSITRNAVWMGDTDKINDGPAALFLDYLNLLTHMELIQFEKIVKKVQNKKAQIQQMWECIGMLEACLAIASFRKALPFYCIPNLQKEKRAEISIQNGYHPMIQEPVANSICESGSVLLTGSNASGKSTFLKTTALCAILAQTLDTVPAQAYAASYFRIYSSMALKDNLMKQESYYIVEIKSLKRILDASRDSSTPMLCFVDEVLRGTNTVERIAASSRILQSLAARNLLCFAATHDIELTHLLESCYANYHFTEEIRDGDIFFCYRLYKGRASTRNAIQLLRMMGYDAAVIEQAEQTAKRFLDTGVWSME